MPPLFRPASAAVCACMALACASPAQAHCWVGSRFFPATLTVDDPCVADEMSLPTGAIYRTGDDPALREIDLSVELSKRITDNFGVSIGPAWSNLRPAGGPSVGGWQNLDTTFKYQFLTLPESEVAMSIGTSIEWGRTGNLSVGADKFSTIAPTVWFGKGFGGLPLALAWARPFAVTAQISYAVPMWSRNVTVSVDPDTGAVSSAMTRNPQFLIWGGTLQYSLPYLRANVIDLGLPDAVSRLTPIVEAQFRSPAGNSFMPDVSLKTTGTVQPGAIWVGDRFQVAAEAIVPINRSSGKGVGAMAQLHLYLDDMFPTTYGRPLLALATAGGAR